MTEQGFLPPHSVRVFWSSLGYSHCCFTAHSDLDPLLAQKVTDLFLLVDDGDPVGEAVKHLVFKVDISCGPFWLGIARLHLINIGPERIQTLGLLPHCSATLIF